MTTHLHWERAPDGSLLFSGKVDASDLKMFLQRADAFDLKQIERPPESAADTLLDLEVMFRRLTEWKASAP